MSFETLLTDDISVRIDRLTPTIARVYFVDKGCEIEPPYGVVIRISSGRVIDKFENSFMLNCFDDYCLYFNNEIILRFSSQRQWNLEGPNDVKVLEPWSKISYYK